MRIGIDARMYGPAQGGLGRYVEQLILHLESINTSAEFVIFLRRNNWDAFQISSPRFKKILADIPWYGWREQLQLPKILKKEKLDLVHFPHWNIPLYFNDPFVVTIHDLLLLHYPTRAASTLGPLTYWFKNFVFRKVLQHAVTHARHIITPSEFTKRDIHATLNIPTNKISVIHLAPFGKEYRIQNTEYSQHSHHPTSYQLPATSYTITKPYVLYVGVAYPHKNLDGLLAAWKIFEERYGQNNQLVLVGKTNYFYHRLQATSYKLQANNLVFTGFITDSDLPTLYQNASLFIMPSFYEGFGLPPLEAMTYGVPVISANTTSLPEILGAAASYFDPHNPSQMADAIKNGLSNQNLRQILLNEAAKLLPSYSWKKLATATWEIYKNSVY